MHNTVHPAQRTALQNLFVDPPMSRTSKSEDLQNDIIASGYATLDRSDSEARALRAARRMVNQLKSMTQEPAETQSWALRCSSALKESSPAYAAAYDWPQVAHFDKWLIHQATNPPVITLPDHQIDAVLRTARDLLPCAWIRLQAGLAAAEEVSGTCAAVYTRSPFCVRAEDVVDHFAIGTWVRLAQRGGMLLPLPEAEHHRAQRARRLLLQLHPTVAEQFAPFDDFSEDQWQLGVNHQLIDLFDDAMLADAEALFATQTGQKLLVSVPRITSKLEALANSGDCVRLARTAVRRSFDTLFGQPSRLWQLSAA